MPQWAAVLLGALAVIITQALTAAFIYGSLTERVKTVGDRTVDHGTRITNIERVVSGEDGHSERLVRLEAWQLEEFRKRKNG